MSERWGIFGESVQIAARARAFDPRPAGAVAARSAALAANTPWHLVSFAALVVGGVSYSGAPDQSDSRVQIGFSIAPVPLNLAGKNRAWVGLGSYLVNAVGGCNDCHTHPNYAPGGDPYAGEAEVINAAEYLAGGRVFGPFTSANITPDQDGLPAGLTFEEFEHLLRTGEHPDAPGMLLQVMAWTIYGKMSEHDLRAIYEYLRSIPSLPNNPSPGP